MILISHYGACEEAIEEAPFRWGAWETAAAASSNGEWVRIVCQWWEQFKEEVIRSASYSSISPLLQEQQEMAQQERKQQQELRLALKQERRAQAQQGHRPYFLKKCEWGTAITG